MTIRGAGVLLSALMLFALPASAQKAKDTLRYPVQGMEGGLDSYLFPGAFRFVWTPSVFDNLLGFNSEKAEFVGQLAKSWSQPNPTTYEYELRDDVKWHDGQQFTADDVVYTINYLINPKATMRNKGDWAWIDRIEKLGPYKVRIIAKSPVPVGMIRMAGSTDIFPKHVHEPLANKEEFGARPVGTGPLKITQYDKNAGIIAERNPDFIPSPEKSKSGVGKVIGMPMNDTGSIVAAMLVGQADVASELAPDQVEGLVKTGNFEVSLGPPGLSHSFIGFPTTGWPHVKALSDVRVRKAIAMAIDRTQLLQALYGDLGKTLKPMESLCFKAQLGCGYTTTMPAYDPAGAKKLLAEAGYADGFDLTISTYQITNVEATAVAGMLRAVGIRASVRQHPVPQRETLIREGKVEMGYHGWSGGAIFDVATTLARHFLKDEYDDPVLVELTSKTMGIMDDTERRMATAKAIDYATENAYIFATIPLRPPITHSKELKILVPNDHLRDIRQPTVHEYGWK